MRTALILLILNLATAGDASERERTLGLLLESREPAVRLYARLEQRGALGGGWN